MQRYGGPTTPSLDESCQTANEKADCDAVLTLAKWIPSFAQWNSTLNFGPTMPPIKNYSNVNENKHDILIQAGHFRNHKHVNHFKNSLMTEAQKELDNRLLTHGPYFMYGISVLYWTICEMLEWNSHYPFRGVNSLWTWFLIF